MSQSHEKTFQQEEVMVMSAWPILAGICVVFVILGVWAIARIFPINGNDTPPGDAVHPTELQRRECP